MPPQPRATMVGNRLYHYVGPEHLKGLRRQGDYISPEQLADLITWSNRQVPSGRNHDLLTVTFVIDADSRLWVADRRSEHVACADGSPVLAAGEMVFHRNRGGLDVVEVTNQSTGYCPEPSCWFVVAHVLGQLGVPHPNEWTHAFDFRRCEKCGTIHVIKDNVFECEACDIPLPTEWNLSPHENIGD